MRKKGVNLTTSNTYPRSPLDALVKKYYIAKNHVVNSGYGHEIQWQKTLKFENVSERVFLAENAWVILCTGMKESIVRRLFAPVSSCFFQWESAQRITNKKSSCYNNAIKYFNNPRKIGAIIEASERVVRIGFSNLKASLKKYPIETLLEFPFIGPVTSFHLAKNLGLSVAKPDRHLVRICQVSGYDNVQVFCEDISNETGEPVQVIDLVLWRYATLRKNYIGDFILSPTEQDEIEVQP